MSAIKDRARLPVLGLGLILSLSLCSCTSLDGSSEPLGAELSVPGSQILLCEPLRESVQREQAMLMQLSQILDTQAHTAEEKAQVFYELGLVYDRLGLESSARSMFSNALMSNPKLAAAYNFVGIYLASDGYFQDACQAFDAALELRPNDLYACFNRGITLYYAGRSALALEDYQRFYEKYPNNPYILLWMYLAEADTVGVEQAGRKLSERYLKADASEKAKDWGFNLVRLYLGTLSEKAFFEGTKTYRKDNEIYAEHLCEGYFYLGKLKLLKGQDKPAYDYFRLSQATHRYGFLEQRYSEREMRILERAHGMRRTVLPAAREAQLDFKGEPGE